MSNNDNLKQHYEERSTEELIGYHQSGGLLEESYPILEQVLTKRGVEIPERPAATGSTHREPSALKKHLSQLWHGEQRVGSACLTLFGQAPIFFILFLLALIPELNIHDRHLSHLAMFFVIFILYTPYFIFSAVSLWRCARNATRNMWFKIARILVILNIISNISLFIRLAI